MVEPQFESGLNPVNTSPFHVLSPALRTRRLLRARQLLVVRPRRSDAMFENGQIIRMQKCAFAEREKTLCQEQ